VKWIALTAGWGIALWALIGIAKMPGPYLDLYFSDDPAVGEVGTCLARSMHGNRVFTPLWSGFGAHRVLVTARP
jgi:hypothetical protein